jgi:putative phosphoesterase
MIVGLVSDTHGRFDSALPRIFRGCDLIVHAGDVVGPEILHQLAALAPVKAVRGNCDVGELGAGLTETLVLRFGDWRALVVHDLGKPEHPSRGVRDAIAEAGARLVIHGHSHQPAAQVIDRVFYVNPGSAGPRRFRLPRCAGILVVEGKEARVELFDLDLPELPRLFAPVEAVL